jgi:hypothetical protein
MFSTHKQAGLDNYYNKLVIINFLENDSKASHVASSIEYRWDVAHPNDTCTMIDGYKLLAGLEQHCDSLFKDADKVQICIVAHGLPGASYFKGPSKAKIPIETLAEGLANFIGDQTCIINLISCGAGRGTRDNPYDHPEDSSAARLHLALMRKTKRNIPIIARTHALSTVIATGHHRTWDLNESWNSAKKNLKLHVRHNIKKQPGSKVRYSADLDGNQTKEDEYYHTWKQRVLAKLASAKVATKVPEKKALLKRWLIDFKAMSDDAIFDTLNASLTDSKSAINNHASTMMRLFLQPTATYNIIKHLVQKRNRILASKHTIKEVVYTGLSHKLRQSKA